MNPELTSLLAACIAFVGGHIVMSHPLRRPMTARLGEKGFLGVYSLVSLAAFAWMVLAFRAAYGTGAPVWNGMTDAAWVIASVLTLVALALVLSALRGNPAAPGTPVEKVSAAQAHGAFMVTRHPMMWGFALWAIAHMLAMPTPRSFILAGSILVLALVGAHLQDRKKEALMGEAWSHWEAQTSYWPKLGNLPRIGWPGWAIAFGAWLAVTWAHMPGAGIPAGAWRWIG